MALVYEFILRDAFRAQAFEVLAEGFYGLGNVMQPRKVDGAAGSAVYSVSRNQASGWVQLLVDDNAPPGILTAIEARIRSFSDGAYDKYPQLNDHVAPREWPRAAVEAGSVSSEGG